MHSVRTGADVLKIYSLNLSKLSICCDHIFGDFSHKIFMMTFMFTNFIKIISCLLPNILDMEVFALKITYRVDG